jgi:uncharacterized protein YjbI with pentapeptide repeats
VVGYDGARNVREGERAVGRKKLVRKAEPPSKKSRWGFRGKKVWDWLPIVGALLVPLVIALGTGWITWQLAKLENQRAQQAQKIENRRAEAERELAEQRAQDEALQAYLNQMSQLMLDRKLLEAEPSDPVHTLAQARTSTLILRLDAEHNESVARFLMNSGLAVRSKASAKLLSEITLSQARLSGADLFYADLSKADLSGADLSHASLYGADLSDAILEDTNLSDAALASYSSHNADLNHAVLQGANLTSANLINAKLSDAYLTSANLSRAALYEANLSRAYMKNANLSRAKLSGADLSGADLQGADLTEAKFVPPFAASPGMVYKESLEQLYPDLSGADLSGADLSGAVGVSKELLEDQAKSLSDATMPNGQKYEEWLKDKKAQGKDEKNEGSP